MEQPLPEVSNITELENGEYSCNHGSGYGPESNGQNGRIYEAIMVEVAKGNYTPYAPPPPPTPAELLAKTDAELLAISARTIEDMIARDIAKGEFVAKDVKDKLAERKDIRSRLQ